MSPARAQVLCVGGLNADHVVEVADLPTGEGKHVALGARWSGGGIAATAAVAISRLGGDATWCGLVADDPTGAMLVDQLSGFDVRLCEKSVVPGARSAVAIVIVDTEGRRWLGWHPGEGTDSAPRPELPCLDDYVVVADLLDFLLTQDAFRDAAAKGRPRVLDMEMPGRSGSANLMLLADHVIFSADGLGEYTGVGDAEEALRVASERLPHATVAVTRGPAGSSWMTATGVDHITAPVVHARDTTGCGDVFHGAFGLGLAEGKDLRNAALLATAAAALKAQHGNGWSGMPSRAETDDLIRKGW